MSKKLLLVLVLLGLGLAGCGGDKAVKTDAAVEDKTGADAAGAGDQTRSAGTALDDKGQASADLLAKRRVYFAFDSNTVDAENRAIVEAQAQYLAANPQTKVVLEGHTDERGTREYNLALGERRAQAVERMLRTLGIAAARIKTVSYGEEKPVAQDHGESAWQLNRRVELVY